MMRNILEIISLEQLRELKAAGYVVVHREPTVSMIREAVQDKWPEQWEIRMLYHRMIGESIDIQNREHSIKQG